MEIEVAGDPPSVYKIPGNISALMGLERVFVLNNLFLF